MATEWPRTLFRERLHTFTRQQSENLRGLYRSPPEGNETGRKFVDVRDSGGPGGPMDPDPAPQREPRGGHINPRERGGGHPGSPAKLTTITKQTVIVRSMWASESNSCFVMVLSPWATVCLMGRP